MWSFTALFSDVVTRTTPTSPGPRPAEPDEPNSNASGEEASNNWEASELSDIRLDISDIQEAIKNHDLWVQDAVVMRNDVDGLHSTIQEHQSWMRDVTSVVRQLQAKEEHLANEITDIRHQLATVLQSYRTPGTESSAPPGSGGPAGGGAPAPHQQAAASSSTGLWVSGTGHYAKLPPTNLIDSKSETSMADSDRGVAERGLSERASHINGVLEDKLVNSGNGLFEGGDSDIGTLAKTLSRQLDCGMRMLRSMVSTVEGSLVRQIDAERAARRAAVVELRHEVVAASRRLAAMDDAKAAASAAAGTSGVDGERQLVNAMQLPPAGCALSSARPPMQEVVEEATASLRSSLDASEHHTMEKFAEADRAIAALRADVAALRSEQQLQAVAAGTLALTSGGLSSQARQRCLTALGERAAIAGQPILESKQQGQEDRMAHSDPDSKQRFPLSGSRLSATSATEAPRRPVEQIHSGDQPLPQQRRPVWPMQTASPNDGNG